MNRITNMLLIVTTFIPVSAVGQVCAKQAIVPEYPPIARAAQWTGSVDLTITVGASGQVVRVEGRGSHPILVDYAKENVKGWLFCDPKKNGSAHVRLRYDYRLEGAPVYHWPTPKVMIDLGEAKVVITSPPGEPQP